MPEVLTFWLDNKNAAGTKTAQLGDQILVSYRDRFYIVVNGAAVMKGGNPLRYSQTSLPRTWKNVLPGTTSAVDPEGTAPDLPVRPPVVRKTRVKRVQEVNVMPEAPPTVTAPVSPTLSSVPAPKPQKTIRKADSKPSAQTAVSADCPYCNMKHEVPIEKGRSGKPFFLTCTKCQNDFAVRLVQVTMYQAQVAGFQ